jgi:micrococcal nuclease
LRIQLSIIAIIATVLLFGFDHPIQASSAPPAIMLSEPSLKSLSTPAAGVQVGQQLVITTIVTHGENPNGPIPYMVFIEVRDSYGITEFLSYQSGKISDGGQTEVGTSWTPHKAGTFLFRTFAISNFEEPQILSMVSTSSAVIGCLGNADCIQGTVTDIVDGDTLDVDSIRIRLTLVNTPEIGEAGYDEATAFTLSLCPVGSQALVDEDDIQTGGSFGRMVAKVTCGDKILNAELLDNGYAKVLTQYCSSTEFIHEDWAKRGCEMQGNPPEETACDPSYPDVCIPPFPPDLDCSQISFRNFRVLPPDPHHFDGDKDGIGCEG